MFRNWVQALVASAVAQAKKFPSPYGAQYAIRNTQYPCAGIAAVLLAN